MPFPTQALGRILTMQNLAFQLSTCRPAMMDIIHWRAALGKIRSLKYCTRATIHFAQPNSWNSAQTELLTSPDWYDKRMYYVPNVSDIYEKTMYARIY